MESAVIEGVATVGKEVSGYVNPKIQNTINFKSNLDCLRKEMEYLMTIVQSVKQQTEAAEKLGSVLAPQVLKWLKDCEEFKGKMVLLEEKIEAKDETVMKFLPHPRLGSKVAKYLSEVNGLIQVGKFPSGLVIENFKAQKVQHIPGPSIDQPTALENLYKVLDLLNDDKVSTIGVWGMGGVGKTTLVKNLNNMLETSDSGANFSIIIWATVSKNADLGSLQSQLLTRLNLDEKKGESMESTASRLYQRLKQEKRFLIILDDVWKSFDLNSLGFSEPFLGNKVILTTRSMAVCRKMLTDVQVRVKVLSEDESWQLFIKKAEDVAVSDNIEPIARKICLECSGLPLAINVVGASMRGETDVALWKDALNAIQKTVFYDEGVEEEVYKPLKWSYDSLLFRKMNVKSCFLYCCLYPEDYSININELVNCWIGEGLLGESDSYQGMVDTGTSMVKYLKDSCLLEDGIRRDSVRMHDVVRDVAIQITSDSENECKSLVLSESSTRRISEDYRRISLIGCLPNFSKQYPEVLSLLLHFRSLSKIPEEYFQKFPALRVLKLKKITNNCRPFFIEHLSELRTLLARDFHGYDLPTLGDLHLLQVLDFSRCNLSTFPEGMEKLTNLTQLILEGTKLEHIREGVISKLTHLEMLDMTGSEYEWDADGERRTPFNELQCLQRLSFLSIRIKLSSSSTTDFSWLGRVRRFHLKVGEQEHWYCKESYARSVIVCRNELSGEGFRSLLQIASHVFLENCYYVERLWINLDKGYSFRALKSLTFRRSIPKFELSRVSSQFDLLPNLEKLFVNNVDTIESVSPLMQFLGSRFPKLRVLKVSFCDKLRYLFTSSDPVPTLESLETVTVSSCQSLLGLYENSASANQKLKAIILYSLPEFSTLFGQQESWEQLEQLVVISCDRINRLPFTAQSASNLKEIKGESEWWNKLEWDDENSSMTLHSYFKPSLQASDLDKILKVVVSDIVVTFYKKLKEYLMGSNG